MTDRINALEIARARLRALEAERDEMIETMDSQASPQWRSRFEILSKIVILRQEIARLEVEQN